MPETLEEDIVRCLVSKKQLSIAVGVSTSTIETWMDLHKIPYLQIDGTLRFDLKKVLKALSQYEVPEIPRQSTAPMPRRPGRPKKSPQVQEAGR